MIIYHGSEDSLDIDAYMVVEQPMTFQQAKEITDSNKELNLNLITIKDGVVDWCYKGTVDECNNSIWHTYGLHKQDFENPVERLVKRELSLKMLRTIRGLLSYFSRTYDRTLVKEALRSGDIRFKLKVLKHLNPKKVENFGKTSNTEVYKFIAFQIGQTLGLLKEGKELFTKTKVKEQYPELTSFLDRKEGNLSLLLHNWYDFTDFLTLAIEESDEKTCKFKFEDCTVDVKGEYVLK